ncbi:MAG TPA: hypothetical protein VEQ63_01995 [Bryobacteraceae bacterium]|nr:hypothetical protein [Bryobacteraceae bacterium]
MHTPEPEDPTVHGISAAASKALDAHPEARNLEQRRALIRALALTAPIAVALSLPKPAFAAS